MRTVGLGNIGRGFGSLFIIYIFYFYGAFGPNNAVLYGLAFILSACTIIGIIKIKQISLQLFFFPIMVLLYGITSLFFGYFVSVDKAWLISSIITLFSYIIVCFDITFLSKDACDFEWILYAMLISAYLCVVHTVFWGQYVRSSTEIVRTMGINNNPNSLALTMVFGAYAALRIWNIKRTHDFLLILSIAAFSYIVIITGSRKNLIANALMLLLWLYQYIKVNKKEPNFAKQISRILVIIVFLTGVTIYLLGTFQHTAAFSRIMRMSDDAGNKERIRLISEALTLWKSSPIFGIGYNQFRKRSILNRMTHNTLFEALSCTGLFGMCFWALIVFNCVMRLTRLRKKAQYEEKEYDYYMLVVVFIIEIFLSIGQVWFYDFPHLLMLSLVFIEIRKLERKGHL